MVAMSLQLRFKVQTTNQTRMRSNDLVWCLASEKRTKKRTVGILLPKPVLGPVQYDTDCCCCDTLCILYV